MRIGIDARFFGPESKGLGRYTQKLVTHLEHIDQKNEYVIFLRRDNFDAYTPQNKNFIKVCADQQWYSFAEQIFFPFALYKQHCDLIHFPHFNVPLLYFGKFIVTIHDLILLKYPTRKMSTRSTVFYWLKFFIYRIVISRAMRKAITIIAVSYFTKGDICARYSTVCNKVSVVYEAAEIVGKIPKNVDNILAKYDIMKPYMLYVGNAYPHKNLHALVDAFARYLEEGGDVSHLLFVGCDDYFYEELRVYIETQKIQNITILFTVSDVLLRTLYENANFFVFPSLYEGFGLPPLEAQLLGIPVLSSEYSCMKEILSNGGAQYCDVSNREAFAQAMHEITTKQNLRKRLVKSGRKNVKKYSWHKMAQETHDIYTKNI